MLDLMLSNEDAQENKAQITAFIRAHNIPSTDIDPEIMILDVVPRKRQIMVKFRRPSCCCTISIYDKLDENWSLSHTIRAQELEYAQDVILESRVLEI
jgi:hypothetical protein